MPEKPARNIISDDEAAILYDRQFHEAGFFEKFLDSLMGGQKPLDCAQIEVTSICPAKCVYCPHTTQASSWKARHMRPAIFSRLWPLLKRCVRAHLQGWGEPLLHPHFFDFVSFARRAGCMVSTTTCGVAMNECLAAKIAASGMDMLAFSLAGTDYQSNAARAGVDFTRVCDSIKTLRKACGHGGTGKGPEIHIAYILLADRMDAAQSLPQLLEDLDVPVAVVSTLDYLATPEHRHLAITPEDTEKIARARDILEAAAQRAADMGRTIHFALPGPRAVAMAGGCRENIARSLYIDADGAVSPCVYLNVPGDDPEEKRRVFGNISQNSILDIWKDAAFGQFRNNLVADRPDVACHNCPKRREIFYQMADD